MIRLVSALCLLAGALPATAAAPAGSAWVGRWFYVSEASRRSPTSFTLSVQPGGGLRFAAGWEAFVLRPDGKPVPELVHPTTLVRTELLTPSAFQYVELVAGRPVMRVEARLSPDGARLLGHITSIQYNGRRSEADTVSLRVGAGKGLAGRWRELPAKHDPVREGYGSGPPQPYWIISQAPSGVMRWHVVPTDEILEGAPDGRRHPSAGPGREGQSFSIKVLGPRHLQFLLYDNRHLVDRTDETLSADDKRWIDLIWSPAYPDEKSVLVYRRG